MISRYTESRLFRGILVLTILLAILQAASLSLGVQKRTLPPEDFAVIITASTTVEVLALAMGAFLAVGRYRVLRDAASYWIGAGCTCFATALVFRLLSYPFLTGGRSLVADSPSSTSWIGSMSSTVFASCLLAATLGRRPTEAGARTPPLWLLVAGPVGVMLASTLFILFAEHLPVLSVATGRFTPLQIGWYALNVSLFGTGAVLAIARYVEVRDVLPGWLAFAQVTIGFGLFGNAAGGNRYSLMAAIGAFILLSGFLFIVFGLLGDHVRLLTQEREKTLELQARSAELTGILEAIPDSVFVTDNRGAVRFISRNGRELLGLGDTEEITEPVTEWGARYESRDRQGKLVAPEDLALARVSRGESLIAEEYRFEVPGQKMHRWLLVSGGPLLDHSGSRLGGLLVGTDITARKQAENRVLELASELEVYVNRLKTLLQEKSLLLRELQHRVKNNLQVVASLASLQMHQIEDPAARQAMATLQHRVRSMALIHRGLCYSGDVAEIDFASYVHDLSRALIQSYAADPEAILLHVDIEAKLRLDEATPCGLIVNELLSNSLKHAFPDGRPGDIRVRFWRENGDFRMEVRDNGLGLPENFDMETAGSLGVQVVTDLVAQLGGECRWFNNAEGGGGFEMRFPCRQGLDGHAGAAGEEDGEVRKERTTA